MQKKKIFKIADSNIEGIGTDADKNCRKTAAATEKEWQKVNTQEAGFYCWRIEKFKVKKNPQGELGELFNDDSYIFLNGEYNDNKKLIWDIYFWLGETTSQDEYGTAAYKTVELDDYMGGDPVQHREVSGKESKGFLKLFSKTGLRLLDGGIESGFNHVEPEEYVPRLVWIKGKNNIRFQQVDISIANLNSGDAFLLDAGLNLYQFFGKKCGQKEKHQSAVLANALDAQRKGAAEVYTLYQTDEPDDKMGEFFSYFVEDLGDFDSEPGADIGEDKSAELLSQIPTDDGGCDEDWENDSDKCLMLLTDESGEMTFTEVATGSDIKKSMLSSDDINILDIGCEVFVHIGANASTEEKKLGMHYATKYLTEYKRPAYLPITKINEGGDNEVFESSFEVKKASKSRGGQSSGPVDQLTEQEDWALFNAKVKFMKNGTGIDALKEELADDACLFACIHIAPENVGNTGSDIVNHQNILLLWKGPDAKAMHKVKFNNKLQKALEKIVPNNGYLETLGTDALTIDNIIDRVRPGSGSKVIEADS